MFSRQHLAASHALATTFDQQSTFPVGVVAHTVLVCLILADIGRDGFRPVVARLQTNND